MSKTIVIPHPDGSNDANVYMFILNENNEFLIISSLVFEEYDVSNRDNYKLPLSEIDDTGIYSVNFPSLDQGEYGIIVNDADRTPLLIGCGTVSWDGSNIINFYTIDSKIDSIASENLGPNKLTVTVIEKDSDPEVKIQSANVRFSKGAERTSKETDSLGVAETGLSNGTWDIVIVRYGYNSYVGSVIVSGDTEIEIELTKNAISEPLAPGLSTGFCLCLSNSGLPVQGIDIFYREATAVSNGYSYSDEYGSFESNQNGLAQFAGFIQGAQYRIWRGQLDWEEDKGVLITVPVADNFELPKHLGSP